MTYDDLATRIQSGDRTASRELFEQNIGLAIYMAQKNSPPGSLREDARQEALFGLWLACTAAKPGLAFASYARLLIQGRLTKWIARDRNVRVPDAWHWRRKRVFETEWAMGVEDFQAVADRLGVPVATVRFDAQTKSAEMVRTTFDLSNDNGGNQMDWYGVPEMTVDPVYPDETPALMERMQAGMTRLSAIQRKCLEQIIGHQRPLREVGAEVGLSYERVRQISVEALRLLRLEMEGLCN